VTSVPFCIVIQERRLECLSACCTGYSMATAVLIALDAPLYVARAHLEGPGAFACFDVV